MEFKKKYYRTSTPKLMFVCVVFLLQILLLLGACIQFVNYKVSFVDNIDKTTEIKSFRSGGIIKVPTLEKPGYVFDGWFYDDKFEIEFKKNTIGFDNITLFAKFIPKYNVIVSVADDSKSIGSVSGGGLYPKNSYALLRATSEDLYCFIGWFDANNQLVSTLSNYSFILREKEVKLTAKFEIAYTDDKYLRYTLKPDDTYEVSSKINEIPKIIKIPFEHKGKVVTSIASYAFSDSTTTELFIIPMSINYIGKNAFLNSGFWNIQPNNKLIYLNNWVIGYKGNPFDNTTLQFTEGTIGIAENSFLNLTMIESIILPESMKYICNEAFKTTSSSSKLKILSTHVDTKLEYIGDSAFENCVNLKTTEIIFPPSYIGKNSFKNTKLVNDSKSNMVFVGNWLIEYHGSRDDGILIIPDGTNGISEDVFSNSPFLSEVSLPKSLKVIGDYAFAYNIYLEKVTISTDSALERIGNYAFSSCEKLKSFSLPNFVKTIGNMAFKGNINLMSISIPDTVEKIGVNAFEMCNSLKKVELPTSLTVVQENLFLNCWSLEEATMSDSVTVLNESAFQMCISLKSIRLSNNITMIAPNVFAGCSSLQTLELPKNLSIIDSFAFSSAKLTSLYINDNIEIINDYAFDDCLSLTLFFNCDRPKVGFSEKALIDISVHYAVTKDKIVTETDATYIFSREKSFVTLAKYLGKATNFIVPETITHGGIAYPIKKIGNYAFAYSKLSYVALPNKTESIEPSAFAYSKITSIDLNEGLTIIQKFAFSNCTQLSQIEIPKSLISIENAVFSDCKLLTSLYLPNNVKNIGSFAFLNCINLEISSNLTYEQTLKFSSLWNRLNHDNEDEIIIFYDNINMR